MGKAQQPSGISEAQPAPEGPKEASSPRHQQTRKTQKSKAQQPPGVPGGLPRLEHQGPVVKHQGPVVKRKGAVVKSEVPAVKRMPTIVKPKIGKHRRGVNRQWFGASWRPLIDFYLQLAHGHEVNRACRGLLKQYWHPRKARASKGKKRNKKRFRSRKSMRMRRSHRRRSHCRKHGLSAFVPW